MRVTLLLDAILAREQMNFIPYTNFQIETERTIEDCMKELIPNVNTSKGVINGVIRVGKFFRGELTSNTFTVRRISKTGTNTKPYVKGTINKSETGSTIDIEMKLPSRVYFNFGAAYLTMIIYMIFGLMDGDREWYTYILPIFILVFGYFFILVTFNQEAELAEEKLMEIFSEK